MRKLKIEWDLVSKKRCSGIVSLIIYRSSTDSTDGEYRFVESEHIKIYEFRITIEGSKLGHSGTVISLTANHPDRLSKEEADLLHTMTHCFFSGVNKKHSCYHWIDEASPAILENMAEGLEIASL